MGPTPAEVHVPPETRKQCSAQEKVFHETIEFEPSRLGFIISSLIRVISGPSNGASGWTQNSNFSKNEIETHLHQEEPQEEQQVVQLGKRET